MLNYILTVDCVVNGDQNVSSSIKEKSGLPSIFKVRVDGNSRACLQVTTMAPAPTISGIIPVSYLTDNTSHWDLLLATYQPGDMINECVAFSTGNPVVFCCKPSIIKVTC